MIQKVKGKLELRAPASGPLHGHWGWGASRPGGERAGYQRDFAFRLEARRLRDRLMVHDTVTGKLAGTYRMQSG